MCYGGFVEEVETFDPLWQTVLGRYRLVLNRDSGSTSLPTKIPLICVPGEQAQLSLLNPNYGGVAQIG